MQKDKENGVLKPADGLCEEHIKGYRSDPCNTRKLNKRFFSVVVIWVFSFLLPTPYLRSTETEFLCT